MTETIETLEERAKSNSETALEIGYSFLDNGNKIRVKYNKKNSELSYYVNNVEVTRGVAIGFAS